MVTSVRIDGCADQTNEKPDWIVENKKSENADPKI